MVFVVVGGGQLDTGGFQIDNSLRFNEADQPRLSRTPASTSGDQTFTLSFWLKRNAVDDSRDIVLFEARPAAGTYFILSFRRSGVADKDRFYVEANTTTDLIFAPLFLLFFLSLLIPVSFFFLFLSAPLVFFFFGF